MKRFTVMPFILILVLMAALPIFATDSVQDQLRKQYVHKTLTLKQFYSADSLKYDSDGNFVGKSDTGAWTVYGDLLINAVNLKFDKLEILASRTVLIYEPERLFIARPWKAGITLEIATHAGPDQLQQLRASMRRIFVSSATEILDAVPEYWKPFIAKTMPTDSVMGSHKQPEPSQTSVQAKGETQNSTSQAGAGAKPPDPAHTLRISSGVAEGLLIKKVEPNYLPIAKAARAQGDCILQATIGKDGRLANLMIMQPVGAGLDDESVRAISQWQYRPYFFRGEPVEVATTITVRFHMSARSFP